MARRIDGGFRALMALMINNISQGDFQGAYKGTAAYLTRLSTGLLHTDMAPFLAIGGTLVGTEFDSGVAIVNGVSAFIPCDVGDTWSVAVSVGTPVPGAGNLTIRYDVLQANIVTGLASAGGGFKITALLADGTINVLDQSTNARWTACSAVNDIAPSWYGGVP